MVNTMHTNLAHDVFIQQGKSIALAQQVDDFLKAQGKSKPTQIPFGQSLYHDHCRKTGKDPYAFSLRVLMSQSVEKAHADKSEKNKPEKPQKSEPTYTPDQTPNRKELNRIARSEAWAIGEKKFNGKCAHHGSQVFNIRKNGTDHICSICQKKFLQNYREKQKKLRMEAL